MLAWYDVVLFMVAVMASMLATFLLGYHAGQRDERSYHDRLSRSAFPVGHSVARSSSSGSTSGNQSKSQQTGVASWQR